MNPDTPWKQRDERPADLATLMQRLIALQGADGASVRADGLPLTFAFRGLPRSCWALQSTLSHRFGAKHDAAGLALERERMEAFRKRAWRFLGTTERAFLGIGAADILRENPVDRALEWDKPDIWAALAIARHYGVPTRLIDWTPSVLIAAYFAASGQQGEDGALWWFSQSAFEDALRANDQRQWKDWEVPVRAHPPDERALELRAFDGKATPWVSKLHHGFPFRRMEVQRGFFTACGRLDVHLDDAIDGLGGGSVARGRVVISAALKKPLLDRLECMAIHAKGIDYPGADLVGFELGDD